MSMTDFQISRRSFLRLCGTTLLAWGLNPLPGLTSIARAASEDTSLDAAYIRQLITTDSSRSRLIMWQSTEAEGTAEVVWRLRGKTQLAGTAPAAADAFNYDGVSCYLHTARIQDLTPGHSYQYRVRTGDTGTPWYSLTTPSGSSFQALIFPDSQSSDNYVGWHDLAQGAAARCPEAGFFINMGDLVDNGADHKQWNDWFNALAGIIDRIPIAPVMGNHETYNRAWERQLPYTYLHDFMPPDNGSTRFPRYYYSFDYGPVHFIVLNTQWEELDPTRPGILDEQRDWLLRDAAASHQPWKIVLMHKDIINYDNLQGKEPLADIDPVGRVFMPLFDELKIDAVLTAHQHTYRRRGHILNFQPSDHGPFYICTGNAGNVYYPNIPSARFDLYTPPQPEGGNYLTLNATPSQLHFQDYSQAGTLMDQARLQK